MKTKYNSRWLAYIKVHGYKNPEEALAGEKKKYPGGCMCGFIIWIQEQWKEFNESIGKNLLKDTHEKFDAWLNKKVYN